MPLPRPFAALAAALLVLIPAGGAVAHVTADPDEAAAGSWLRMALRISHGCEGSPTVAVRVKLPEGVASVRPQMKPGWTIEIETRTPEQAIAGPHGPVSEVVDVVTWRGGPLPDAYFDEFGLTMKLPDEPGRTLHFPTVQECAEGVNRWIGIPGPGESAHDLGQPAPAVTLTPVQ